MNPEELAALVVKRSADLPSSERAVLKRAFPGAIRKAGSDAEENTLTVVASTVGTADDRSGDVIFPGAYRKAIEGHLTDGFVALGHGWDDLPVAMPTACEEVGNDLLCTATFHTTPEGQAARTVCRERMEKGLSVSLSVGILPDYDDPDGVVYFAKGQDLLSWAKAKGYDMALFDQVGIRKLGVCRAITAIAEFPEWSIVGVGMNRGSKGIAAKSLSKSAGASFSDRVSILQDALRNKMRAAGIYWAWLVDVFDATLVYQIEDDSSGASLYFEAPYTMDGLIPSIGDGSPVARTTKYESVSGAGSTEGKTFDQEFSEVLAGLDSFTARWMGVSEKRERLGDSHRTKLAAFVERFEAIAAKSEPAPGAEGADPTHPNDAETKSRQRALLIRAKLASVAA